MINNVFTVLNDRGYFVNSTLDVSKIEGRQTVYIGFDLTAPSLHVGSLVQLMVLRRLAEDGHKVIVLLGEATTRIGDPSDKDKSRPMLDEATITANRTSIERVVRHIVPEAEIRSNLSWFGDMDFLGFLREFGPHFTINRMNAFDTVKRRLDNNQPMTFLEYSYMLLQAIDFLHLSREEGCTIQIGGSDQWGNIINGVELVRRLDGHSVHGLTTVLLTDANGKKMGKTIDGAVWLDSEMLSPFDFFQFWRNIPDSKVEEFFALFTSFPLDHIKESLSDINLAKERLAFEITCLVHSEDAAKDVLRKAHAIFQDGEAEVEVALEPNEKLSDVILRLGWAPSKGAGRRLMSGGAVLLEGVKVLEDTQEPRGLLKVGKKKVARIL